MADKHELTNRAAQTIAGKAKPWMDQAAGLMRKPIVAAAVTGGAVAAVAGMWGATEAAIGVVAAYAVYRSVRRRDRLAKKAQDKDRARGTEPLSATAE